MKKTKLHDFELCDSPSSRMRGLMFRKKFKKPLLFKFDFPAKHAIHSFFVLFEFDAVFLNDEKKVVDVFKRIKPFTPLIVPKKNALFLIEFPAGVAEKKGIKTGDAIVW
ncbi:DUF192 domain-containing protein [Candidatus Micrarchaeota archaeon]|nr:DUF192 domain-containing protein [Candidatus Micrarchaeota archaeon]